MSWRSFVKLVAFEFADEKGWDVQNIDTSDIELNEYQTFNELIDTVTNLTNLAKELLYTLDTATTRYENDENINTYIYSCDSIIQASVSNLDRIEAVTVGCGASIAKNSAEYWSDNSNWEKMLELCSPKEVIINKSTNPSLLISEKHKKILQSDIEGACAGALSGFLAGAPGGATAFATALAGALINGSSRSMSRGVIEALGIELPWWADWVV